MTQSIQEQVRPLPAIESEAHLLQIGGEMLGADLVPRSHDSSLEKREGRFHSVCVNIPIYVAALTVNDCLVILDPGLSHGDCVGPEIVCEDNFHILADVFADVLGKRAGFCILGVEEAKFSIALADAQNGSFVRHAIAYALAAIHTANVGRINFDFSIHHRLICLGHGVSDAVTEIPRGLVTHSDRALNLASGHTLLCLAQKMGGQKPFGEREMGVIEYRPRCNGELVIAILAVEELLLCLKLDHIRVAAQAAWTLGPAEANKQGAAFLFRGKQCVYIH